MHYHVITAKNWTKALASVTFDNYEDSLLTYTSLATEFFVNMNDNNQLSLENAREATANGDAIGAYCGNEIIAFFWVRCDERCSSGTWN